ncbi:MAG: hypothetical protein SOT70_02655 [Lachnospiraceae bacterium]|nr:hypothetical protein [Lachnospiraceae bacterium]
MEQKWIICIVPLIILVCAGIVIEMIRGLACRQTDQKSTEASSGRAVLL